MTDFDPTRAPTGRLARLGLVVDSSGAAADPRQIALLADRAGIQAIWVGLDTLARPDQTLALARLIAPTLRAARMGVFIEVPEPDASRMLASAIAGLGTEAGPVELTLRPTADGAGVAEALRKLRPAFAVGGPARPRLSAVVSNVDEIAALVKVADDLVLEGAALDLETGADEARAEAAELGRDPATMGVAALVPVSVGRTQAEASARMVIDPAFQRRFGDPSETGIFGTLEECQDRVIALAHAGVTDLRCILPWAPDVIDVIAQLTSLTIGTTDVLVPGSLRSPAPAPPEGWGGRPERPPEPRVSGGSRRR